MYGWAKVSTSNLWLDSVFMPTPTTLFQQPINKMMCCELMETKKIIMKLIKSHRKKYEPSPFKVRLVTKMRKEQQPFK